MTLNIPNGVVRSFSIQIRSERQLTAVWRYVGHFKVWKSIFWSVKSNFQKKHEILKAHKACSFIRPIIYIRPFLFL